MNAADENGPEPFQRRFEKLIKPLGVHHVDLPPMDSGYHGILNSLENTAATTAQTDADRRLDTLKDKKRQIERAISRLDDVYLMDEHVMTKREYMSKRAELHIKLNQIDSELSAVNTTQTPETNAKMEMKMMSRFFILHKIMGDTNIREVYYHLDKTVVQDFFQQTFQRIEVAGGQITQITFPGGITHKLIYIN